MCSQVMLTEEECYCGLQVSGGVGEFDEAYEISASAVLTHAHARVWGSMHACCLAEELQVCDRHFSFLVSSLSNQPVGVHPRHRVNGNELVS